MNNINIVHTRTLSQQKLRYSPYSVDAELVFNAEYFLKSESSSLSQYSSSIEEDEAVESEEMEVVETNPFAVLRQQQRQQQQHQLHLQQQQYYHQQHQQLIHQHRHRQQRQQQQEQMYREQQLYAREQNFRDFEHNYREPHVPTPVMTRVESPSTPVRNHSEFIKKAANNHMSMLTHIGATNAFKTSNSYATNAQLAGYESFLNPHDLSDSQSRVNNLLAEEYEKLVDSFNQVHEKEKKSQQFKLPSSKSPIMEALVYCSINKYGIELKELNTASNRILFYVSDFNAYYKQSCSICSKQSPSEDIRARMKALQRWFVTFPAWRELEYPFELLVRPSHYAKMHEIISKMVRFYENADALCG